MHCPNCSQTFTVKYSDIKSREHRDYRAWGPDWTILLCYRGFCREIYFIRKEEYVVCSTCNTTLLLKPDRIVRKEYEDKCCGIALSAQTT